MLAVFWDLKITYEVTFAEEEVQAPQMVLLLLNEGAS